MKITERFRAMFRRKDQRAIAPPPERELIRVNGNGGRPHSYRLRLPGATPDTIRRMIQDLNTGELEPLLSIAHEMEEIDPHYGSVLGTRKDAVAQLPYVIDTEHMQAEDGTLGEREAAIVEAVEALVTADEFAPLLMDLLDGLNKGFSVCEIMWERTPEMWQVCEYRYHDQRIFTFDRETGRELLIKYAPDDERPDGGDPDGYPMAESKFIVHYPALLSGKPTRGALARPIALFHLLKMVAVIDWAGLVEIFGQPFRLGKYPAGSTQEFKDELFDALHAMGADAAAIVQDGCDVEFVEAGKGTAGSSGMVYSQFLEWIDSQTSKRVLGQTMTTDDGSSLAQAKVHSEVREDIRNYDAGRLGATIRAHLITPFVKLNFGDDAPVPKWRFEVEDPEDLVAFATAITPLVDRGLPVPTAWVADKFGMPAPEENDDLLQALVARAVKLPAEVFEDDYGPMPEIELVDDEPAGDGKGDGDKDSA